MKWKNRDINVEERANIPKFSKLADKVNSFRLLELFFGDVLRDMSVGYIKLYNHREKAAIFEITNEKICLFLSMITLEGVINFQTVKCIRRRPPILLCKQSLIQCLVILLSALFGISISGWNT